MATSKAAPAPPTYESVWGTLSKVDCSDHVEQKMGLSYLSWAWAWGIMMDHYPDTQVVFPTYEPGTVNGVERHPDGTATVHCNVYIGTDNALLRSMWLPVMDNRNKAIQNPDARAISDAKMRCMVKAFALYGLGHYIYAGEDLPSDPEAARRIDALINEVRKNSVTLRDLNEGALDPKYISTAKSAIGARNEDALMKLNKRLLEDIQSLNSAAQETIDE